MSRKRLNLFVILLTSSVVVAGCITNSNTNINEETPQATFTPSSNEVLTISTFTPEIIPSTPSPVVRETTQSTPTRTLTPAIISTWTPRPTLKAADVLSTVEMYLKSNGDCELPCWWGIEPGKTTEEEIHRKLGMLGITTVFANKSTKYYSFSIEVPAEMDRFGVFGPDFLVRDGRVMMIAVSTNYMSPEFGGGITGLLQHLGKPEEIWLTIYPYSISGQPHYDMDLYFPKKGVLISFSGLAEVIENQMYICPHRETLLPPGLILLKPGEVAAYDRLRLPPYNSMTGLDPYDSGLKPLDAYETNLTIENFYSTYSDPANTQCFQIQLPDP